MWLPDLWKLVHGWVGRSVARGDEEEALKRAEQYARLRPNDPEAWVIWAQVLLEPGHVSEAQRVLREGWAKNPGSLSIGDLLATALRLPLEGSRAPTHEAFGESWELMNNLVDAHPDSPIPALAMAIFYAGAEEWDDARLWAADCEFHLSVNDEPGVARALGATLMGIPGERGRGQRLLERAAEAGDSAAPLMLAVLLEGQSPGAAAPYFDAARRFWRGDDKSWDEEVESCREWARTEVVPN